MFMFKIILEYRVFKSLKCMQEGVTSEAELKEFEPRLKFKLLLKYDWFHLKLYSMFQDLSRRSIETSFGGLKTRLKFIKFGHRNLKFHPKIIDI